MTNSPALPPPSAATPPRGCHCRDPPPCRRPGHPANLQTIGVSETDLPAMAAQAIGVERLIRLNPGPVTVTDLEAVLRDAWVGDGDHLSPDQRLQRIRGN